MAKLSIKVRSRTAKAQSALSSLTTHGEDVVRGLLAQNEELPPERQLDENEIRRLLDWLATIIEHKTETMKQAELTYVFKQANAPAPRTRRDEALPIVIAGLLQARSRIKAVLGTTGLKTYGLSPRVPRRAAAVATYAGVVINLLRKYPLAVSDGLGGTLDTMALARGLETSWQPLHEALTQLLDEHHARAGAMLQRDTRVDDWHESYQGGVTAMMGLYRIAGQHELARRIRHKQRRRPAREATPIEASPAPGEP